MQDLLYTRNTSQASQLLDYQLNPKELQFISSRDKTGKKGVISQTIPCELAESFSAISLLKEVGSFFRYIDLETRVLMYCTISCRLFASETWRVST